jgi:type IV pilus assembly protein PilX
MIYNATRKHVAGSSRHRQKGMVSTLIALIVLVTSLLAAMALMRSVDTSNTVAGNLTFRQAVLQEAERAYVDAQQKITFSQPTSDADDSSLGYYAEPQPATARSAGDIPNVLVNQTSGSYATVTAINSKDNTVTYIVERLCSAAGSATTSSCIVPGASISGGSSSNQTSDNLTFSNGTSAAFRLTVRVTNPKGAVAYVQTIMR